MRCFVWLLIIVVTLPVYCVVLHEAEIDLTLIPDKGLITASTCLRVEPVPGDKKIQLLVNRGLVITGVHASVPILGFHHQKSGPGPYQYAPQATELNIPLAKPASGAPVQLRIVVEGKVEPDQWGVIQVSPRWVELEAVYSGWFPFSPGRGRFDLILRVHAPEGWIVAGTGAPQLEKNTWTAKKENVGDVVVLASPRLKKMPVGKGLALWHVDLPSGIPELIISDTERVRKILSQWFGPVSDGHVDLVFPPRKDGGGFARPGLVLMVYDAGFYNQDKATPLFIRYLAHEVSHLWWLQAPTTSWQDWLNESFAEFTALMILRKQFGERAFLDKIQAYRQASARTPPIKGIPRNHKLAFKALYRKGPVILADLEASIGRKAFMAFLRALIEQKTKNTAECLEILEKTVSTSARRQLESALSQSS